MAVDLEKDVTEAGNYFIANYPPFSFWTPEQVPAIEAALGRADDEQTPLGLYLHIPFCRKRCKFCYFRVYTDIHASAIQSYVDALGDEIAMISQRPAVYDRRLDFVYFGGGTPSFLSARQLIGLVEKLRDHVSWHDAREVTFECEPGTLSEPKLAAIKEIGGTRLSLGVENFGDVILETNGRAHLSAEIFRAWDWIVKIGFPQVNIDLIAGMVGETWSNWRDSVKKTIDLAPDSVTIYQLELPYNTRFTKSLLEHEDAIELAPWSLKRDWVSYAFDELLAAGYEISSAYTLVKRATAAGFLYRDSLWHGADLLGTGVASFGHLSGVHYQNLDAMDVYESTVRGGTLPIHRALAISPREALIREMILQMKLGRLEVGYFERKFGVAILEQFSGVFADYANQGWLSIQGDWVRLTRDGLLRVDALLPRFFQPEHRTDRYV